MQDSFSWLYIFTTFMLIYACEPSGICRRTSADKNKHLVKQIDHKPHQPMIEQNHGSRKNTSSCLTLLNGKINFATQNLFGLCLAWNFLDAQTSVLICLKQSKGQAPVDPHRNFGPNNLSFQTGKSAKLDPVSTKAFLVMAAFSKLCAFASQ